MNKGLALVLHRLYVIFLLTCFCNAKDNISYKHVFTSFFFHLCINAASMFSSLICDTEKSGEYKFKIIQFKATTVTIEALSSQNHPKECI
jgi:hypothetical protein